MGNEMGNEKGVVGPQSPHFSSLMWLGVVSFSFPSLSIHQLKHVEVPMDGSESYYWMLLLVGQCIIIVSGSHELLGRRVPHGGRGRRSKVR